MRLFSTTLLLCSLSLLACDSEDTSRAGPSSNGQGSGGAASANGTGNGAGIGTGGTDETSDGSSEDTGEAGGGTGAVGDGLGGDGGGDGDSDANAEPRPCCDAHGGRGCEEPETEACICALVPECCSMEWLPGCAQLVSEQLCDQEVRDCVCLEAGYGQSSCCENGGWNVSCAALAELNCYADTCF